MGNIYNLIKEDSKELGINKGEAKNIIVSLFSELSNDESNTLSKYESAQEEEDDEQEDKDDEEEGKKKASDSISKIRKMANIEMRLKYSGMGSLTEKEKKDYKEYIEEKKLREKQKIAKDISAQKSKEAKEKKPEPIVIREEKRQVTQIPSKKLIPKSLDKIILS